MQKNWNHFGNFKIFPIFKGRETSKYLRPKFLFKNSIKGTKKV
jgi:hypothetical protein